MNLKLTESVRLDSQQCLSPPRDCSVSDSLGTGITGTCFNVQRFCVFVYVSAGDSNSGPHTSITSTLPMEPIPQPCVFLLRQSHFAAQSSLGVLVIFLSQPPK